MVSMLETDMLDRKPTAVSLRTPRYIVSDEWSFHFFNKRARNMDV